MKTHNHWASALTELHANRKKTAENEAKFKLRPSVKCGLQCAAVTEFTVNRERKYGKYRQKFDP